MKSKILVTGANGQLGNELRELAPSSGHQFYYTDIGQLDLTSETDTRKYLDSISPDYIINCAAYTAVDKAESDAEQALAVNAVVPEILVAYARDKKTRLIHISTDYVFSGKGDTPLKETDVPGPESVYGRTKLIGEFIMESHPQSIIIRTSWLYSSYGKNFVKTMVGLMAEKKELQIVFDQYGTPTYAADLAGAILQIIKSADQNEDNFKPGYYHYSNEGSTTWFELAGEIKKFLGSGCVIHPVDTIDYPLPAPRPMYSVMSKEKIVKAYGIEIPSWKDSLEVCLKKMTDK